MFKVTELELSEIADPFQILKGKRYEFIMNLEIEEDDELFDEQGVQLRVIYVVDGENYSIARYEFLNAVTKKYIDIEMEDDELMYIDQLCKQQILLED